MTTYPENQLDLIEQQLMESHKAKMTALGRNPAKYESGHSLAAGAIKHLRAKLSAAEALANSYEAEAKMHSDDASRFARWHKETLGQLQDCSAALCQERVKNLDLERQLEAYAAARREETEAA